MSFAVGLKDDDGAACCSRLSPPQGSNRSNGSASGQQGLNEFVAVKRTQVANALTSPDETDG